MVVLPDRAAGTVCPLEALAGQCLSRARTADTDGVVIVAPIWLGWIFGVPLVLALLACALVFTFCPGAILSKFFVLKVLGVTGLLAIFVLICVAVDWSDRPVCKTSPGS